MPTLPDIDPLLTVRIDPQSFAYKNLIGELTNADLVALGEDIEDGGGGGGGGSGGSGAPGEVKLTRSSATALILSPHRGRHVAFADETVVACPIAGVTLANTGLSADTTYYIYAVTSDDTVVTSLEASTTAYDFDTSSNIAKKQGSGNEDRLFVGMIRTNSSSQFVDHSTQRFVRTWFNDSGVSLVGASVSGGTSSTTYVAQTSIGTFTGGIEALLWANEWVDLSWVGYHKNSTAGALSYVQVYQNGAVTPFGIEIGNTSGVANDFHVFHCHNVAATGTEGYNYFNGYSKVTSGTTTIQSGQLLGHTRGHGSN
jgi:hypothetical protein